MITWPHDVVASLCSPFSESSASVRLSHTSVVYTIDPSATGLANASYSLTCCIFDQDADVSSVWVFKQAKWPWKYFFPAIPDPEKERERCPEWLNNYNYNDLLLISVHHSRQQRAGTALHRSYVDREILAPQRARRNWGKYITEIAAWCIAGGNRLVCELVSCLFQKPTRGRSNHLFSKLSYIWAPQIFVCHVLEIKIRPNLSFNTLKTSPEYTQTEVYRKYVL